MDVCKIRGCSSYRKPLKRLTKHVRECHQMTSREHDFLPEPSKPSGSGKERYGCNRCRLCKTPKKYSSLYHHVRRKHKMSIDDYEEKIVSNIRIQQEIVNETDGPTGHSLDNETARAQNGRAKIQGVKLILFEMKSDDQKSVATAPDCPEPVILSGRAATREYLLAREQKDYICLEHIVRVARLCNEDGDIWTYQWREGDPEQLHVYYKVSIKLIHQINLIAHMSPSLFNHSYILNVSGDTKIIQYICDICKSGHRLVVIAFKTKFVKC